MKMRSLILLTAGMALAACSKVPAGNVGVKAYLLGSSKGVDAEVLGPGRYWIGWNEELYLFPTFTQTATWAQAEETGDQRIVFQDVDGLKIAAGVGLTYSVERSKVALLFQKYRRGIDEITDTYLRNMTRDALVLEASRMRVGDIYGPGKEALMERVTTRVRRQVEPVGIRVERIYWTGDMQLPDAVVAALNAKIGATQKAEQRENELRETEAEAKKAVAQAEGRAKSIVAVAEAEAEANKKVAASVSPELIAYTTAKKWNGQLPTMTSGAIPFVQMPK